MRPGQLPGLKVSSPLLLQLIARAAHFRSGYANKIVARGIFGRRSFEALERMMEEQPDAGAGELAAAGVELAGRAEEVREA